MTACSISVFHVSVLDSLISSGFQRTILDYAKIVSGRAKTMFYNGFTNLGSIDNSEFWI